MTFGSVFDIRKLKLAGKYEEADSVLAESLEKDPNHLETVINQVVVSQFLGKSPEVSNFCQGPKFECLLYSDAALFAALFCVKAPFTVF